MAAVQRSCAAVVLLLLSVPALPPAATAAPAVPPGGTTGPVPALTAPAVTASPNLTHTLSPGEQALLRAPVPRRHTGFDWRLPRGFPQPAVPADNPMSDAKVALGRRLFFDTRLSVTGHYSCASCHDPRRAYTDGRRLAVGATGGRLDFNAPPLMNVAWNISFGWQHPEVKSLEDQMRQPLFNRHPVELGLTGREAGVARALARDPDYPRQFKAAFATPGPPAPAMAAAAAQVHPAAAPAATRTGHGAAPAATDQVAAGLITTSNIIKAVAAYERTLVSAGSPFDRYVFGGRHDALSPAAKRGMALFFSPRLGCGGCHSGFNFAGNWRDAQGDTGPASFADNGTGATVRVPTLRDITRTAPYMHDGRYATLDQVIDHYERAGRAPGRGRPPITSSLPDKRLRPFILSPAERADLKAFLASLTGGL